MPRQAHLDTPGALHHIICRAQNGGKIFRDDTDRDRFLCRLGDVLLLTSSRCFAWALLPNHFHLLLRIGTTPLGTMMRRLLAGYAVSFNRRHHRAGGIGQNRFKIICHSEPYLLEQIRYIHLSPLRAGIVKSLEQLEEYDYCGHSSLLAANAEPWQATQEVLDLVDQRYSRACLKYISFVAEGVPVGDSWKEHLVPPGGLLSKRSYLYIHTPYLVPDSH